MEFQSEGMFGYTVTAHLRTPNRPAGQFAFQHWLNYRRAVQGLPKFAINDKVYYRTIASGSVKAVIVDIDTEHFPNLYTLRVTSRAHPTYYHGEIIDTTKSWLSHRSAT